MSKQLSTFTYWDFLECEPGSNVKNQHLAYTLNGILKKDLEIDPTGDAIKIELIITFKDKEGKEFDKVEVANYKEYDHTHGEKMEGGFINGFVEMLFNTVFSHTHHENLRRTNPEQLKEVFVSPHENEYLRTTFHFHGPNRSVHIYQDPYDAHADKYIPHYRMVGD